MNPVIERISKEGVSIEKHYGRNVFSYHSGANLITYPAFEDLNVPRNIFNLAHELGHHLQRKNTFLHYFASLGRTNNLLYLLLFPFILLEEIDAWIKGWRICKGEKIALDGFITLAVSSVNSYCIGFLNQILSIGKRVIGLYIGSVFLIRFIIISEEMNLQQPEFLTSLRYEVINSSLTQNELVTETFQLLLFSYLIGILLFIIPKFLNSHSRARESSNNKGENDEKQPASS
ncbi:hypothetical protein ACOMCU_15850 [Lysinibacillus sp. UGB7]|uniref:hypothetical protein n=1 Tax=Lysinibacillus sp. UGB7 TaxID=3411039 RepID=UPI003B82814C